MEVKQPLLRIGALLCVLLCISWVKVVFAHDECPPAISDVGERVQEGQSINPEQVVSKSEDAGLKKVLTTRNPRRTDIPDYMLVVMLALVGVVVISRRNVSGIDQDVFLKRGRSNSVDDIG